MFRNSRNGSSQKTLATEVGDIDLAVVRDRAGSFTPMLVPKGQRRLDGLDPQPWRCLGARPEHSLSTGI
ncbi:hypothetical protein FEF27_12785 [Nesterenkonia sphaerica]|uniref:Uncharacterized protein n=1 Tax=Nesterenkonia sphaerica TaxID=1804988 RepID=A0A5R8ZYV8_9MICC|nr:hypothetical protein FEF27_12785 [Nesterenkonia sphaerica]